jgi:crotonobetainyl-CoA:carnitine CoA-transferase CaiB-like acyl-CoA transferase
VGLTVWPDWRAVLPRLSYVETAASRRSTTVLASGGHDDRLSSLTIGVMGQPEQRDQSAAATATPEQVAQARARVRRKLAAAAARHTPEYWAALRARLGLPARTA